MNLNDSISVVIGVGPQRVKVLNGLGVENIKDMLYYFPRRYLDRTTLTPIKDLKKGDQVTLISKVETLGERRIRRGTMFQIIASDGTGLLTLNWFNGFMALCKCDNTSLLSSLIRPDVQCKILSLAIFKP